MADEIQKLPDRQALAGAADGIDHEHHEGWRKFIFDVFIAALLALIFAVLIDLALHPSHVDAKPILECGSLLSWTASQETIHERDLALPAVFSCVEGSKIRPRPCVVLAMLSKPARRRCLIRSRRALLDSIDISTAVGFPTARSTS